MGELKLDEKNCQVVWNTPAEQAQNALLGWRMLENNEVQGILPFDYYYIDDRVCFRCSYAPLERIECYFQKNAGDFESISCICEGIFRILERGEEYLLGEEGYLLLPEWIFWNRYEKKVAVCYLPGRRESVRDECMVLIEYLMQHTDHSDKKAVSLIYGLYDMAVSENFVVENFLHYLQKGEESEETKTETEEEKGANRQKEIKAAKKEKEKKSDTTAKDDSCGFFLNFVKGSSIGKLQGRIAEKQKICACMQEGQELIVGRQKESDIYLPFAVISRKHAVFIYENNRMYLMDISSTNGTYLNGKKISAYVKTQCRGNDVITFADISYRFEAS